MSTPCAVGTGAPGKWSARPCKTDGYFEWAGVFLVDRLVRNGFEATARELVDEAPNGWNCLGGSKLDEVDDFLADSESGQLNERTSDEILARHYAIYLIDPTTHRLHWRTDTRWESSQLEPGDTLTLPPWYPSPPAEKIAVPPMPAAVKKELQTCALAWDVRWDVMLRGMRAWIGGRLLHELEGASPSWLVLGTPPTKHRVFIGDVTLWLSFESHGTELFAADGRMRSLDLSLDSAQAVLSGPIRPPIVTKLVSKWFDLAWKQVQPEGSASWNYTAKKWGVTRGRVTYYPDPLEFVDEGVVPRVLAWLYG